MINFTTLRYKNFLSTGNAFTELRLDERRSTLVVGENGSGKSTMLDAICFALFGKAFRNINKPQLPNSVNLKNCLVEIEFHIGKRRYKVVRGIKPAVFEIWVNDKMINQEASTKDYQKYLEESILKLNFKSFTQIVILGAASFTPFMQLPAAARREIIEDLLDIRIFSTMNVILKERMSELKSQIISVDTDLKLAKQKVMMQDTHIKSLLEDRQARLDEIATRIDSVLEETSVLEGKVDTLMELKEGVQTGLQPLPSVQKEMKELERQIDKLLDRVKATEKDMHFYNHNDECPTCKQGIQEDFKTEIIQDRTDTIARLREELANLQKARQEEADRLEKLILLNTELNRIVTETSEVQSKINANSRFVQAMTLEQHDIQKKVGNVEQEKVELRNMAREVVRIAEDRSKLNEDKHYLEVAASLLKDSGVKTKIIRKYLAPINKLVNKYLQSMDFFVHFELDETFKEVIKSRHRDEFSYESFSEGEKQRIDLALLFTWRTIAKMKNSASTNLLILDEVFDSSLDASGTDYVMSLLSTLGEQVNVWVISHKGDQLADKFTSTIKFTKKQNFSVIA